MDLDARALLHRLAVPFDVTVHDYFAICPQVNLLPTMHGAYCGEPDIAGCNACIANRPSHGSRDIVSWRRGQIWQFLEAERVFCPSEDVRRRLARYGVGGNAIVTPHEPVSAGPWPLSVLKLGKTEPLRVAVLGVLAPQKGALTVMAVASAAEPARLSIQLIGHAEQKLPPSLARRIAVTGAYQEGELPSLLAKVKPHVAWFPSRWPETYSYTLSAAIEAGLPIVASRIGAFPERLAGRALTWLVDPEAPTCELLAVFDAVHAELARLRKPPPTVARVRVADYYREQYVRQPAERRADTPVSLRRDGRLSVVVIPELYAEGGLTPCAYIRLLQPLDHPDIGGDFDLVLADAKEALRYDADIIATQRYAVGDLDAANALVRHCRQRDIKLLYDLDDDLLHTPRSHPDARLLRPKARVVSRLVRDADAVWVSTPALAASLADLRPDALVAGNGLDERLWLAPPPAAPRQGPVRILFMGTQTHDADLAIVEEALERLKAVFGEQVSVELLGISRRGDLPPWMKRLGMPAHTTASYPGFVEWITQQHWDIGIAPLADTAFNRSKSGIKALDYAALGLPVLASDRPAYRGTPADGPGGWLLPDETDAWFVALARLVRDASLRRRLSEGARGAVAAWTLAAQAAERRAAWLTACRAPARCLPARRGARPAAPRQSRYPASA